MITFLLQLNFSATPCRLSFNHPEKNEVDFEKWKNRTELGNLDLKSSFNLKEKHFGTFQKYYFAA